MYDCILSSATGLWTINFTTPSSFDTPITEEDLRICCRKYDRVLLLGVFSWSNWSRNVAQAIQHHASWFETAHVGVAVYCLDNEHHIARLSPDVYAAYLRANADPLLVLIVDGNVKKVRFGPVSIQEIQQWVQNV